MKGWVPALCTWPFVLPLLTEGQATGNQATDYGRLHIEDRHGFDSQGNPNGDRQDPIASQFDHGNTTAAVLNGFLVEAQSLGARYILSEDRANPGSKFNCVCSVNLGRRIGTRLINVNTGNRRELPGIFIVAESQPPYLVISMFPVKP